MKIPEPKIEKLVIPEKILERLNAKLDNKYTRNVLSSQNKDTLIKKYVGYCAKCGNVATTKITYELKDYSLIEKYCDKHVVVIDK